MGNLRQMLLILVKLLIVKVSIQQDVTDQDAFFYHQQAEFPKDCQEVMNTCVQNEIHVSGVYFIKPEGYEEPFEVFCDQENDGGGWTVLQRRKDNSTDFARPWQYYKDGFGFLNQEFWLGNDKLAHLTNQKQYVLRMQIDLDKWVLCDHFRITDEKGSYKLVKLGECTASERGVYKDRMKAQEGFEFSTRDRASGRCGDGVRNAGGWWFTDECWYPNLNGELGGKGVQRLHWMPRDDPTFTEMKIKPAEFA